ncbi:uncharacterized protein LOC119741137 [Patiria miniata]|uniref:Reverse transcriptase domain-containing protein n=1 Tax=Patiria miniata TaxID=46514 RepID=A0A914B9T3_PATMI|nr:uncharacterized protein LOC119741137 [Patiria miniata]
MIFMYLDDELVLGRSRGKTEGALRLTWHLASDLGFLINTKKSHPVPLQVPTFLGASLDLRRGLARPSEDRLLNLRQCLSLFLPTVVARPKPGSGFEAHITQGCIFRPPRPSVLITTNASGYGWGATLHPQQVAGVWGPEHQSSHINVLEMLAVANALKHFQSDVRGQAVLVRCDNATVLAYINHQGGTRSGHLCALTWDLTLWCIHHGIALSAVHIPGEENVTADALSRGWIATTEWSLLPQVAQSIFRLIDRPHVDLFASRMNNQLPIYCTRGPDPNAWQTDALSVRWDSLLAYAFPPISLVSRVLTKIEQEDCGILLIALFWPRQPWFPWLVRLLVHRPVILPRRADLLYQPSSGISHQAPGDLHLTCWVLSRDPSAQQAFRDELQQLQPSPAEPQPERCTIADYAFSLNGVDGNPFIPPILHWPANEGPIRAHEVRGVSTSWACFKGVPLGDIVKAACWKNPNTFFECYLKDVLQADGKAGREVLKAGSRASQKH